MCRLQAYQEQLITLDELRSRMPDLRARETNLRNQLQALDNQIADRDAYLKLAENLEDFLTRLHTSAQDASIEERRRVLRLLVKNVLIGPEKITIQHRIPIREHPEPTSTDTEGDRNPVSCQQRWGRALPADLQHRPDRAR